MRLCGRYETVVGIKRFIREKVVGKDSMVGEINERGNRNVAHLRLLPFIHIHAPRLRWE